MDDQERSDLIRELNLAQMKIDELRGKIRKQDRIIQQLRSMLADLGQETVTEKELEEYKRPQRGRPQQIDEATRQRIRTLKEGGMSVREIAKKEGVSLGTVSAITSK